MESFSEESETESAEESPKKEEKVPNQHVTAESPVRLLHAKGKFAACPLCDYKAMRTKGLHTHLQKKHDITLEYEYLQFKSEVEFDQWKMLVEITNSVKFGKRRTNVRLKNGNVVNTYSCSKNGFVRQIENSVTVKAPCLANIKVFKTQNSNILVTYQNVHVGHDVIHNKISVENNYLELLNIVLDTVKDTNEASNNSLTEDDLHRLKTRYEVIDTTLSIEQSNEWFKMLDDTCVLFYKPKDVSDEKYPYLRVSDFVLIVMNDIQKKILTSFSEETICVDHSCTLAASGYETVSISVIFTDSESKAFPCAFLITNRMDDQVVSLFYSTVEKQAGNIMTKCFISDEDSLFYNSWCEVMSVPKVQLYSLWLLDRKLREALSVKTTLENPKGCYQSLVRVMDETKVWNFEQKLEEMLGNMIEKSEYVDFALFFGSNYVATKERWSNAYRTETIIKHHREFEMLHRTLKFLFQRGVLVSLDEGVRSVMQHVRNNFMHNIIMLNKEISLEPNSEKLLFENVVEVKDTWKIPSNDADVCVVQKIQTSCNCQGSSGKAEGCLHELTCSCIASSMKWDTCKHVQCLAPYVTDLEDAEEGDLSDIQEIMTENNIDNKEDCVDCEVNLEEEKLALLNNFKQILRNISSVDEIMTLRAYLYAVVKEHVQEGESTEDIDMT